MKNNRKKIAIMAALISIAMLTAGCASSEDGSSASVSTGNSQSESAGSASESSSSKTARQTQTIKIEPSADTQTSDTEDDGSSDGASGDQTAVQSDNKNIAEFTSASSGKIDTSDLFSNRDLSQTADTSEAKAITVSDDTTLEITDAGVYVISGTASECTIKVNADSEAKVQLVLDGVSITNSDFPAIYVVSADKCFITTASGSTNSLSVTGSFTSDGDTNTDAVIFSKDDIVFNGEGSLTVTSNSGNGITSKDDLKVTGGTYSITSALDAVEANDSIRICGGDFKIVSSKDGFHAENSDDDTLGYVYIADGSFDITAKSDGIQATSVLQIDGGSFSVSASEGLESTYVQINGGSISISATDDGINASQKSKSVGTPAFEMTGGSLTISMSGGDVDCIDANGTVTVSGGTIDVSYPTQGPSESFDYDSTASFTGGTVIINGTQVDSIPTPSMMGGGGRGGMGGPGGDFDGDFGGDFDGGFGGRGGRMH